MFTIDQVIKELQRVSQLQEVKVQGWVKSFRQGKRISFLVLNDGSCFQNLQVVCANNLVVEVGTINFGSCLKIKGKLILTPDKAQPFELQAQVIEIVNTVTAEYPLQKQHIPLDIVRKYPHLRAKTNYFLAMFRLRNSVSFSIHQFLQKKGFLYIHTPLITANDTEGAGQLFTVTTRQDGKYEQDFFNKQAKLTVSGQLQAESLAQGLNKVYTFSPCFRAENSHTTKHLAEFWMIEPEIAFANLQDALELAESLLKYVIVQTIDNNYPELKYFENYNGQTDLINKLKAVGQTNFCQLTYDKCIDILKDKVIKDKKIFVCNEIKWGMNLQSEHEKYLCQYFNNQPIFVLNYPQELKAFYMKNNPDSKTVANFDCLFPQVGEMIGGGSREENYQVLKTKAQKLNLDINNINWYLDLRKFGYAPSAGFGLGLERLLMFLSDTKNIRDVIPFPCYPQHLI